jgi:hypothetical protein
MEHIFNVAISMDDDRIKETVANKAEKEIMANLTREVGRVIFEKCDPYYGSRESKEKGYNPNCLSGWAKMQFEKFLKDHKDEIIAGAAKELADRLARTKAAKAIFENLGAEK